MTSRSDDDTTTEKVREDKKGEEKGRQMKKPPAVSGDVPTYGRRLFTSIYTRRVIILTTPKGNCILSC